MHLTQLVYISSMVTQDFDVINNILASAIKNNSRREITGALLYFDGGILQVLEGRRTPLYETFNEIANDNRHTGLIVLMEKEILAREFADWRMGFKRLSKSDFEVALYADYVFEVCPSSFSNLKSGGEALKLIKSFTSTYGSAH